MEESHHLSPWQMGSGCAVSFNFSQDVLPRSGKASSHKGRNWKDMPEPKRKVFTKWVWFQCMERAGVYWWLVREGWVATLNPSLLGYWKRQGTLWELLQYPQAGLVPCVLWSWIWPSLEGCCCLLSDFRLSQRTEPLAEWEEANPCVFNTK